MKCECGSGELAHVLNKDGTLGKCLEDGCKCKRYKRDEPYEVYYTAEQITANMPSEFIGKYATQAEAERAATLASERVTYGEINIYNTKTKKSYEYWPSYKRKKGKRMRA